MNGSARNFSYLAYGLLGLPLAMAALPVYVHVPAYYSLHLDVSLAQLGWVLFAARLIDTAQDPVLGLLIDRSGRRMNNWFIVAAGIFAAAFACLWLPPKGAIASLAWLGVTLVLVYAAHSFLSIAYLAWGASLDGAAARAQVLLGPAAAREAAGLVGILIASAIPAMAMSGDPEHLSNTMVWYSLGFAGLLLAAVLVLLCRAPAWQRSPHSQTRWLAAFGAVRTNQRFLRLLPAYLLNALSVSLPATLVLFYIRDQLQEQEHAAAFLLAYFTAAVCGLPGWVRLAKHIGPATAWRCGMHVAVGAFCAAALLDAGDVLPYFLICVAAGMALGADLALPPVLFAHAIGDSPAKGTYYSIYTMLGKLAAACCGLALPLLAMLAYRPGAGASTALVAMYAGLPCLLKIAAMYSLRRSCEEDRV